MDATERAILISKAVMWTGILLGIVAIAGEILGWWNETGEAMLTVATVLGAVGGLMALVVGSTSGEVQSIGDEVQTVGGDVRSVGEQVASVHDAVADNGEALDSVDTKLDKLDKLDELDLIQAELDRQTGALDRQVEVLGQIRDRL